MAIMVHSLNSGANIKVFESTSSILNILFVPKKNRLLVGEAGKLTILKFGEPFNISQGHVVVESTVLKLPGKKGYKKLPVSMAYSANVDTVFIGEGERSGMLNWVWGTKDVTYHMGT